MRIKLSELKKMQDWEAIAVGNIERHLGDVCCDGDESADVIYEEAYTLALDALVDAGVELMTAGAVATRVAQRYGQP